MCTAVTVQSLQGDLVFGRTMDFSHDIQPHCYMVPRNYTWINKLNGHVIRNSYRFLGIGQALDGLLAFFDGVNEHGFAAAALYFAGYARYKMPQPGSTAMPIASFDFIHYILGNCTTVEDLAVRLKNIDIIGMTDPVTRIVAPLHWIAMDRTGACVVLEYTERGGELHHNFIGVLANSPDFGWHMTNLNNYTEATPHQIPQALWGSVRLTPFGQAGGTVPLPGGYTSPERFIRTAYLKTHIPAPPDGESAVIAGFHILKSVSIPKGAVVTSRNTDDYTKYTAMINTRKGEYYFQTYDNPQIYKARLQKLDTAQPVDLGQLDQPVFFEEL